MSYFRIINILYQDKWKDDKNEIVEWIRNNLGKLTDNSNKECMLKLGELGIDIPKHLYKDCRCAIAHANQDPIINPDNSTEIFDLYFDVDIIKEFAGLIIETEMNVSRFLYD